jgi:hypothetical protein
LDCIFVPLCVDGRNLHLSLEQHRGVRSDCRFLTLLDNAAVIASTTAGWLCPRLSAPKPMSRCRCGQPTLLTETRFSVYFFCCSSDW